MNNAQIHINISCLASDLGHVLASIRRSFTEAESGVRPIASMQAQIAGAFAETNDVDKVTPEKVAEAAAPLAKALVKRATEEVDPMAEIVTDDKADYAEKVEKPTRKRRTKAEMEAERAAETAKATANKDADDFDFTDEGRADDFVEADPLPGDAAPAKFKEIDDKTLRAFLLIQNTRIGDTVMGEVQKYMVEVRERMKTAGDAAGAEALKQIGHLSQVDRECLIERLAAMPSRELKTAEAKAAEQQHVDFLASIAA